MYILLITIVIGDDSIQPKPHFDKSVPRSSWRRFSITFCSNCSEVISCHDIAGESTMEDAQRDPSAQRTLSPRSNSTPNFCWKWSPKKNKRTKMEPETRVQKKQKNRNMSQKFGTGSSRYLVARLTLEVYQTMVPKVNRLIPTSFSWIIHTLENH